MIWESLDWPPQQRPSTILIQRGLTDSPQLTTGPRAVQLLLGHSKVESTVRYLGIEVDDALMIAEQVDI